MANGLYEFGPFRLDVPKRFLTRDGQPIQLKPKTFDLLVLLVRGEGRVLTKAELIKSLWAETFVEEGNLTFQISTLRKALGDEGAQWIETVPKHGYRFAVDVPNVGSRSPDRTSPSAAPRRFRWVLVTAACLFLVTVIGWSFRGRQHAAADFVRVTPLTAYPGEETHPSFSPDGSHLAFAWDGERQTNWDIYTKAIGPNDTPLRLTTDPAEDRFPAWSPQGSEIAFLRNGAVFLVSASGGAERKLAHLSALSPMSWSPDGKYVLVSQSAAGDQPGGIVLVPVQGGEQRRLTIAKRGQGHENPQLAPDARSLAFLACYEHTIALCDAYVVQLNTDLTPAGEPRRETHGQTCRMCGLAWTPDARSLVYGVDIGVHGLWRVNVTGADVPRQIAIGPDQSCWPAISARARRLVYSKFTSGSDIWILETNGGKRKLLDSTRHDKRPQFSPDGTRIAFVSDRSGLLNIWVANADGSAPVRLTPASRYSASPRWSPDGNWIAYDEQDPDDGNFNVFVIDSSGRQARQLVDHSANDAVPSWSRDGKWIYFTSNRHGDRHEIFRVPVSGGQPVQVTDAGGFVVLESADGRTLYYTKTGSGASPLFARSTAGGPERQVLDSVYFRSFAVTDAAIYYIKEDSTADAFLLNVFELSSGRSKQLTRIEGPNVFGITVSPDEQQILYTLEARSAADLMLAESFR